MSKREKQIYAVWDQKADSDTPIFTVRGYTKTDAINRAFNKLGYGISVSLQQGSGQATKG